VAQNIPVSLRFFVSIFVFKLVEVGIKFGFHQVKVCGSKYSCFTTFFRFDFCLQIGRGRYQVRFSPSYGLWLKIFLFHSVFSFRFLSSNWSRSVSSSVFTKLRFVAQNIPVSLRFFVSIFVFKLVEVGIKFSFHQVKVCGSKYSCSTTFFRFDFCLQIGRGRYQVRFSPS